ncbi:ECF RNA polymerase sigma factor SigM [Rhodoplanes serenus]|uniref:ECF RNA polymerase sigma factor SigM n=1 Tax=Rhodoplanes serenus TaxID=200615 RepID=A0A3S4FAH4_9BRAD|nr:sigma-70 family RNA polymerase sigma factor [Rhodoplanes serenus]MBI5110466.1 sigma-70 family RNA polymerase sigma factor [Rhodovulum sp.]VCU07290.1 ECF RNA polymerase sigma factor SigM [Rhodoplanes serenus]
MHPIESELKALMVASLAGDARAHRDLLRKLSGYLRGYYRGRLTRMGRGVSEAEDLVQEALMAIHVGRHTYDTAELLTPWVHAIARYKLLDFLRRTRVSATNVALDYAEEVVAVDDSASTESALDLGRLLTMLPARMREAIQMVKIDGLSVAEAATRSGASESAIKVNIHRGLKALSAAISRERTP